MSGRLQLPDAADPGAHGRSHGMARPATPACGGDLAPSFTRRAVAH
jgi:hypothetical protein